MTTYLGREVAEIHGIPYRTLMRWAEDGLLNPVGARRGHRYPATWHETDVREASVLAGLRRAGFSLQRLREAVDYLRSIGHNPMSSGAFLVVRTSEGHPADVIKFCDTGEAIALLRRPGQLVFPLWAPDESA